METLQASRGSFLRGNDRKIAVAAAPMRQTISRDRLPDELFSPRGRRGGEGGGGCEEAHSAVELNLEREDRRKRFEKIQFSPSIARQGKEGVRERKG